MGPKAGLLLVAALVGLAHPACARPRHAAARTATANPLAAALAKTALLNAVFVSPEGGAPSAGFAAFDGEAPAVAEAPAPLASPRAEAGWRLASGRFGSSEPPVTAARQWPAAVALSAGEYDLDFSPHAGFGWTDAGGAAEAGGMVRVGANLRDDVARRLNGLGVREVDRSQIAGRGRWFLFAAASGRAVDFNMVRDGLGGPQRLGWAADGANAMISDAQAGVGWRRGVMQASFGYVHREIHSDLFMNANGEPQVYRDSMVAFSLSLKPR